MPKQPDLDSTNIILLYLFYHTYIYLSINPSRFLMFYLLFKCLLKCSLNAVFEARSAIIDMTSTWGCWAGNFQCCYRTKTSRGEREYIHFYHVLYSVVSYSKVVKLQPWRPTALRLKPGYWACSLLAKKDTSSILMGQYEIYLFFNVRFKSYV